MEALKLINGEDLTEKQKSLLSFRGMKNPDWIKCHAFYFINNKPASKDSEYFYPVIKSLKFLPY